MVRTQFFELASTQQKNLLHLARQSITAALQSGPEPQLLQCSDDPQLATLGASFVTINKQGLLRGCIGTLMVREPLYLDVMHNAVAAATCDPRFPALTVDELTQIQLSISILSQPERVVVAHERELLGMLVPGTDGVILQEGSRRATFLPSVWQQLAEPDDFLRQLKQKGGWSRDYWSSAMQVSRYHTMQFGD